MRNFYKDPTTGEVYGYDDDQVAAGAVLPNLVAMTAEEIKLHLKPPPTEAELHAVAVDGENVWRITETAIAKDNLDAILFEDPDALPGTDVEWKAYGVALRKWKESNPDFPDSTKRPPRPT